MSSDGGKRKRQNDDEGADFSDNGTSQSKIAERRKRKEAQNKIRCQRYRDKKKKETVKIVKPIYEDPIHIVEEKMKRSREYNKQRCQRYRDKKRASNLIRLHTDQFSETVVRHLSNSQIADPPTGNVPYDPPIYTADLSTLIEPYITESHSDYDNDIHNIDPPSQVNNVPQLHEPISTPNVFLRVIQNNTENMHSQLNLPVETDSSFQRNSSEQVSDAILVIKNEIEDSYGDIVIKNEILESEESNVNEDPGVSEAFDVSQTLNQSIQGTKYDEYDTFAAGVASKLRKLKNEHLNMIVQRDIGILLYDALNGTGNYKNTPSSATDNLNDPLS